jgi:hypothetical protein
MAIFLVVRPVGGGEEGWEGSTPHLYNGY